MWGWRDKHCDIVGVFRPCDDFIVAIEVIGEVDRQINALVSRKQSRHLKYFASIAPHIIIKI